MASYQNRLLEYERIFSFEVIDTKSLNKLAFSGCPHEKSIRSRTWKVMLAYLPIETKQWNETLENRRKQYSDFINEMIIQPGLKKYEANRCDVTKEDHPLNPNPEGQWSQYFKDNDTLLQIDKDCRRLYPGLGFFQKATSFPCMALTHPKDGIETLRRRVEKSVLKAQNVSKTRLGVTITDSKRPRSRSAAEEFVVLSEGEEAHWEVAERILFIYSKLNPGQGYVQGMNEILGPIYYTFASDTDITWQEFAEADAFWCFTNLMSEIRDNFIKAFDDDNQSGTDVLRLWDTLFADDNRFNYLILVCCGMLMLVREELLTGDFPHNMKLLQNYPGEKLEGSVDILKVISKAVELEEKSR